MSDRESTVVECQAESLQSIFILNLYYNEIVHIIRFYIDMHKQNICIIIFFADNVVITFCRTLSKKKSL